MWVCSYFYYYISCFVLNVLTYLCLGVNYLTTLFIEKHFGGIQPVMAKLKLGLPLSTQNGVKNLFPQFETQVIMFGN